MSKKVCLVIPPSPFLLDERVFVSLGILKVASSLVSGGVGVDVIDLSGVQNFEEAIAEYASRSDVSWFGLTATTPQMPAVYKILRRLRAVRKDVVVCLGGPHPTLVAAAVKSEKKRDVVGRAHSSFESTLKDFDIVVAGDGEDAIFAAVVLGQSSPGVYIDADDPKGKLFMSSVRYDETPFPARELVDMRSYHYTIEGKPSTSLIAQLGCPFQCTFCGGRASPTLRRIRTRTTRSIIEELRQLYTVYGYTGFMFYDDELNVNKDMVNLMRSISDLQSELGVDFRLRGFVKAELFTDEQAAAMHAAGFRWLLTGFESGSPRILENIVKKATRDDNTRAVEIARRAGMKVKALMSIGHAGESQETVDETRSWLLEVRPDDFDVTIITTYPGSPYYDDATKTSDDPPVWTYVSPKTGDRLHSYELDYSVTADYYKGDPDGGYRSYVYTDFMTAEQLVVSRDAVEREVREKLSIPFNPGAPGLRYEHSMGQGLLPTNMLRSAEGAILSRKHLTVV